jgi:hypothetical protein
MLNESRQISMDSRLRGNDEGKNLRPWPHLAQHPPFSPSLWQTPAHSQLLPK